MGQRQVCSDHHVAHRAGVTQAGLHYTYACTAVTEYESIVRVFFGHFRGMG